MIDKNVLGDRGEAIFFVTMTKFHGDKPLFRPASLGAKWPIADYAVELYDSPGRFFLVQVKATRGGVSRNGRIGLSVTSEQIRLLLSAPVPVFIAAVDEPNEAVFIVRPRRAKHLRTIATTFPLDDAAVRLSLHREVYNFWEKTSSHRPAYRSAFLDR